MTASTTQATTRITKGRDGWEAETIIGMGVANRVLLVRTTKARGGMVNRFTVNTDKGDGFLSWDLFGDYNKRTEFAGKRCTVISVTELHARALREADQHLIDAAAHYAKKEEVAA